ncbi:peptide chain release factor 1 [Candidatus Sumerlaeota bacterium]|nr:peptide chain release factor 1 [Candidatus Sumerlaeales bacterium]NLD61714.1 peptide chain release factor 1 [Candidatus Sumerlaeota bacterium]
MSTIDFSKQIHEVQAKFAEVEASLSSPEVVNNPAKLRENSKIHADLGKIVEKWNELQAAEQNLEGAIDLRNDPDPEMAAMAEIEAAEAKVLRDKLETELQLLLLPGDPLDERNTVFEIRAGTGGEEAALFAYDLFRMYTHYAEQRGWKVELLSSSESGLNGFKEVIFLVSGDKVYSRLKFEAGTHRVQRVPETEAQGRIHTSAATVAVLPEAEEVDVEIRPTDLRIDVFHSGGPGGQSVNTTDSAVRITHLPTGLVVSCQDEKSQLKNKAKALKVLRSRLLEAEMEKQQNAISGMRRKMVGSGDRSERIRTYNFPQNRLTDHRINLTLYSLDRIMEGDLDTVLDSLISEDQMQRLQSLITEE